LLGCDEARARAALMTFPGVERRLQRYGLKVYDDYAHNPEKLRALWTTLAAAHPEGGVCVVWRPHGYAPLRKMAQALADMFNETIREKDKLLLLPVYDAGGTADRSIQSSDLADRLRPGLALCVKDLDAAYNWAAPRYNNFAAFAVAGARDPELPALAARIASAGV
jgi:UDP-N-acetylmuramate--alanine ligase